ncbi:hypothetical protein SASPL_130738 [Salvia splendens]|uniref:AB hydrolase-1 domain-containing protein n=1 Tax=Salvia splendens TaxID=180675 RepID=A0A8X8ZK85_SALSN|nr:hypothetical protein SASPL_130738 [Salvia splendens]
MKTAVQSGARMGGRLVMNEMLSFLVFSALDVVDMILCYVYKVADFLIEAEWKACYCSSPVKEITVSKIVRLTCSKLQLEEISDTLSLVSKSTAAIRSSLLIKMRGKMLFSFMGLYRRLRFGVETLYPKFSKSTKSKYRLFAMDLLGFGRSPKPTDSLYTLREHLEMIQPSVLVPYDVKSFHIVARSLGCILALALAVSHPSAIKSLTLLAPVGEAATQHMMRRVARVAGDRVRGVDGVLVRAH